MGFHVAGRTDGRTLRAQASPVLLPSYLETLPADLHGSDTYIAMRLSWSTTTYASMTLRIRHPRPIGLS
jgi:hypothetical protein